jgi:hypothetical protein
MSQLEEARVLVEEHFAKVGECNERLSLAESNSDKWTKSYKDHLKVYRSMMLSGDGTDADLSREYLLIEVTRNSYIEAKKTKDAALVAVKLVAAETQGVADRYRELVLKEAAVLDGIVAPLLDGAL